MEDDGINELIDDLKLQPCCKCKGRAEYIYMLKYISPFCICKNCRDDFNELVEGLRDLYQPDHPNLDPKYFH